MVATSDETPGSRKRRPLRFARPLTGALTDHHRREVDVGSRRLPLFDGERDRHACLVVRWNVAEEYVAASSQFDGERLLLAGIEVCRASHDVQSLLAHRGERRVSRQGIMREARPDEQHRLETEYCPPHAERSWFTR